MARRSNVVAVAVSVVGVAALFTSQAHSAGLEKSVFWSGHYAGIAGAAQSSVTGPEALYWNPAGLAGGEGLKVNGDFSPTLSKFSGPSALQSPGSSPLDSSTSFSPIGAGFASYGITPKWGVGIGYYVTAGTRADYDSIDPTALSALGITYAPPLKADVTITELSLGTGYEVAPGLKIGAAYRIAFANADIDSAGTSGAGAATTLVSTQISGASATAWTGVKVGVQYEPEGSPWGFGVDYRNQIRFVAGGTANVTTAGATSPTGASAGSGENVLVSAVLPQQLNAAAHYHFLPDWTGFLGYTFTNYSQEQTLGISGVSVGGALQPDGATSVPLNWNNMHNVRIAAEYTGIENWTLRGGYVWTSQVTPAAYALPIFPSPGTGNTVVFGAGHPITPALTGDAAFEYSWDSGSASAADSPAATTATGDYAAHAIALHLGLTYAM